MAKQPFLIFVMNFVVSIALGLVMLPSQTLLALLWMHLRAKAR